MLVRPLATILALCTALAALALLAAPASAALPDHFQASEALGDYSDFVFPTAVRFAPDGKVFVAEKYGRITEFDNVNDSTPTEVTNLAAEVYNFWDRGLLGLAIDPQFDASSPTHRYIYALYARNAWPPNGTLPKYQVGGSLDDDPCPTPPGPTDDGCVVGGRLVRIHLDSSLHADGTTTLLDDWCQQYPSHSVGDLHFGPDGDLYVSGGEGAGFNSVDHGQLGDQHAGDVANPCGDPPSEGGALRSQSFRRGQSDDAVLGGAILRVDPATGDAAAGNPAIGNSDANRKRIVAYGLRNPFRFAFRPGTSDLWTGDVGWNDWEEINHDPDPTQGPMNFGWPCYEGIGHQPGYDNADLGLCESLYSAGSNATDRARPPFFAYKHFQDIVPGDNCKAAAGSSISGLAFYDGNLFPSQYDGALFFADYSRKCIWVMFPDASGDPDPSTIQTFDDDGIAPTDLQVGPDGALYYPDFDAGEIARIDYDPDNQRPTAMASASPTSGNSTTLHVTFSSAGTSDPDQDASTLTYDWDLNGNGVFGDSGDFRGRTPPVTDYSNDTTVRLRVTDDHGAFDNSGPIVISPGNTPPTALIGAPIPSHPGVGDTVSLSAQGSSDAETPLNLRYKWLVSIRHCPGGLADCHVHPPFVSSIDRDTSFVAPDHEYPSSYQVQLTVTDLQGLSDTKTIEIDPDTVKLNLVSAPAGLHLSLNSQQNVAPIQTDVIAKSKNTIAAPASDSDGTDTWDFGGWDDNESRSHDVTVGTADATFTASFLQRPRATAPPAVGGEAREGQTLTGSDGSWEPAGQVTFDRQWQRCDAAGNACANVTDTNSSYALTAADVGKALRFAVTAHGPSPNAVTATSPPSGVVSALPPTPGGGNNPITGPPTPSQITRPDTRAPSFSSPAITPQYPLRSGTLRAWLTCPWENCLASVRTALTTTGRHRHTYRLSSASRWLTKNRRGLFTLHLTRGFRAALAARLRTSRSRLRLGLTIRVRDRGGNARTRRLFVTLRR